MLRIGKNCGMNVLVPYFVVADDGANVVSCYIVTILNPF